MMYPTVQWMCVCVWGGGNLLLKYVTTEITCVKGPLYSAPKHLAICVTI